MQDVQERIKVDKEISLAHGLRERYSLSSILLVDEVGKKPSVVINYTVIVSLLLTAGLLLYWIIKYINSIYAVQIKLQPA